MKKNVAISGILGLVAAIVYLASMTGHTVPNVISAVCGALAVVLVCHLVRIFVASPAPATLASLVAATVFMLTPAVRAAATHFEPRLLAFAWALLIVVLALPFLPRGARAARAPGAYAILAGAAWAFGLLNSALFLAFLPLYLILLSHLSRRAPASGARAAIRPVVLFFLSALPVLAALVFLFHLDPALVLRRTMAELASYYRTPGWLFVFFFTTLPFLAILLSDDGALSERPGPVQLLFHGALTFVTILAVVPPFSPSALMAPYGRLPVTTSAFAASVAGYLVAYWWTNRRTKTARVLGGLLVLALAGVSLWNLFSFDAKVFAPTRRVVIKMDAARAQKILKTNPDSPLANYVMGSIALKADRDAEAVAYLRKAIDTPQPFPVALNDYAEVLRRGKNYAEAERCARRCVASAPKMYVGWETLGSILMDAGKGLDEAESAIRRACELSKGRDGRPADVRMLVSLARVQLKRGDLPGARKTFAEIEPRLKELPPADRAAFEHLRGGM